MSTNRREFIRNISLGAAGITIGGAFSGFKSSTSGPAGANERINLACCGIGNPRWGIRDIPKQTKNFIHVVADQTEDLQYFEN